MRLPVGVHVEFGHVPGWRTHMVLNDTWFCAPNGKRPSKYPAYVRDTTEEFLADPCQNCLRMLDGDPAFVGINSEAYAK
jgi:hypothetical protein